jgi:ankyrin repeat protein
MRGASRPWQTLAISLMVILIAFWVGRMRKSASPHSEEPSTTSDELPGLHLASEAGDTEAILTLLAHGADINAAASEGITALHLAAASGKAEVARLLLDSGALVSARDSSGLTPLHLAAAEAHVAVARELLAAPEAATLGDSEGMTALHYAAHYEAARQSPERPDLELARLVLQAEPAAANATNHEGASALHIAAMVGNEQLAELLLRAGAAVHARNLQGFTPLHASASEGNAAMTRLLLQFGAEVNSIGQAGYCPLLLAGQRGHLAAVRAMLEHEQPRCGALCPSSRAEAVARDHKEWLLYFAPPPAEDILELDGEGAFAGGSVISSTVAVEWDGASMPSALPAGLRERLARVRLVQLASAAECEHVIREAEAHAARHGGWNAKGHHDNYKTTDIEVTEVPAVLSWLNAKLEHVIWPHMADHFDLPQHAFWLQDCFIVKYELGGQAELTMHQDGSEVTFQVLLSDPRTFEGGGTYFEAAGATLHLEQGQMITHYGQTFHAGLPLHRGVRYLLVGLVRVRLLAEAHALCKHQRC